MLVRMRLLLALLLPLVASQVPSPVVDSRHRRLQTCADSPAGYEDENTGIGMACADFLAYCQNERVWVECACEEIRAILGDLRRS